MRSHLQWLLATLAVASAAPALAALNVFATVPEWGALTRGAGRRQGQGLHRHQRAAGSASRRGEAEPDRVVPAAPIWSSRPAPSSRSAGCRW